MILVTGGNGYLGSHITRRLVENGHQVRVLIRNPEIARQEKRLSGLELEWATGDVTKPDTLAGAIDGVDTVIHTVAIAVEKGSTTYESVNYQGTVNVVEASRQAGVSQFINISQLGAKSDLPYRFLASKGLAQDYVAESDLNWTAFRPSVIWGPEDEFANTFAKLVPFSPIIYPIVDRQAKFEPVWVEDVSTAVVGSINNPAVSQKEFELGGPEILSLEEIEARTLEAVGAKRKLVPVPPSFIRLIVTLMEKILPNPPVTRSLLELLAVSNVTSSNAITMFVQNSRPFTSENIAPYMKQFSARQTLSQFFIS